MKTIIKIILAGLAVAAADYLLPGIALSSFWTAIVAGLVIGLINALIRPIVLTLTLPINILTLGLFTLVINALMVMLAGLVVPGFQVASFWSALLFSIVVSLLNMLFDRMAGEEPGQFRP